MIGDYKIINNHKFMKKKIGRIRFVLDKNGFTKEQINKTFSEELPQNPELRRNLCKDAISLGWKSENDHLDFDELIKIEEEKPNTSKNAPPKDMFIPTKEFLKNNVAPKKR